MEEKEEEEEEGEDNDGIPGKSRGIIDEDEIDGMFCIAVVNSVWS